MTVGLSATNLANVWLNILRGVSPTAPAGVFVKLHTADPGAAGITAPAAGSTSRPAITWAAAAAGAIAMTGTAPSWTNGGTNETLTHLSLWDSATAGNFLGSVALTNPKTWASTDTFTLITQGWSITPIAS